MGDGIHTPFSEFVFLLVLVGIPFLIFGMPIVVLVLRSARRTMLLNRKRKNESLDAQLAHRSSEPK
jgi:hypothetical protein